MSNARITALPSVGSAAPDFALPSTSGSDVRLSSFKGRQNVLLAFFPLAFTSTCTAEMMDFSEEYARYSDHATAVLPISVDSVPALRAFKQKEGLRLDLLSDFRREVSRAYGVLKEPEYFSERAYVLIDRVGAIRWAHIETSLGDRRATGELIRELEALTRITVPAEEHATP